MACALTERIGPHPKSSFSGLRFRFRAYTLHLAALACLPFRLSPSSHDTSERLTRPYSGELPASAALSQLANIARLPRLCLCLHPLSQAPPRADQAFVRNVHNCVRFEWCSRTRGAKWRLFGLGAAGKAANLGGCKSLYRQLLDSDGEHIHCSGREQTEICVDVKAMAA